MRFYCGASLAALTHLETERNYRLVAAEPEGANAYFLRNDMAPEIPGVEVARTFRMMERQNAFMQKKGADVYDFVKKARLPLDEVG